MATKAKPATRHDCGLAEGPVTELVCRLSTVYGRRIDTHISGL